MIGRRSTPQAAEEEKPKGFDDFDVRLGDLMRGERATLGKSLLDVQRELKIKATYIAAIENADISAFESPGFVAGYIRSYARYLNMDPDECFRMFCREANYTPTHGMAAAPVPARGATARTKGEVPDPIVNPNIAYIPKGPSLLSRIEPGAIGSLLVLAVLVGAIGYGGWSILQEVQRVQLAPVDQAPTVVVEVDPLPSELAGSANELASDAVAGRGSAMDRLYRPQALDVPVMTSRNGPIGAINPRAGEESGATELAAAEPSDEDVVQVTVEAEPGVEILAVRPAWIRVSAADGTVLFEKILDSCERYSVPALETAAQLRSGNAGGVYFVVNGKMHGPAGQSGGVVKGVSLDPEALAGRFAEADPSADRDLARILTASTDAPAADLPPKCLAGGAAPIN